MTRHLLDSKVDRVFTDGVYTGLNVEMIFYNEQVDGLEREFRSLDFRDQTEPIEHEEEQTEDLISHDAIQQ